MKGTYEKMSQSCTRQKHQQQSLKAAPSALQGSHTLNTRAKHGQWRPPAFEQLEALIT